MQFSQQDPTQRTSICDGSRLKSCHPTTCVSVKRLIGQEHLTPQGIQLSLVPTSDTDCLNCPPPSVCLSIWACCPPIHFASAASTTHPASAAQFCLAAWLCVCSGSCSCSQHPRKTPAWVHYLVTAATLHPSLQLSCVDLSDLFWHSVSSAAASLTLYSHSGS